MPRPLLFVHLMGEKEEEAAASFTLLEVSADELHVACIFMQLKGQLERHTHTYTDYDRTYHSMAGASRLALNCKPQRHLWVSVSAG